MIKAVHIEDEPNNIALLQALVLEHCKDIHIIGNAKNVGDGLQLIKQTKPQLLYLDIELNQNTSFELLEQLKNEGLFFHVIFITAHNDYAAKAFRYDAVDYLLKPISIAELKEATAKAVERIKKSVGNEDIFEMIRELKNHATASQKIGLPVADGVVFVNTDDIVKCEAKGSYTVVYMANKKNITSARSLKELEGHLTTQNFVRVHNSWVINTKYLKKYYRGKNSYMEMEDGSTVSISLRKKSDILSFLKDFE